MFRREAILTGKTGNHFATHIQQHGEGQLLHRANLLLSNAWLELGEAACGITWHHEE